MPAHLAWPLRLDGSNSFAVLEQDSPAELAQSVQIVLLSTPGERPDEPDFGLDEPAFSHVDAGAIIAAITRWEPRADPDIVIGQVAAGLVKVRVDVKLDGNAA